MNKVTLLSWDVDPYKNSMFELSAKIYLLSVLFEILACVSLFLKPNRHRAVMVNWPYAMAR